MYLEKTLNAVETNSFIVEIFGLGYVGFPLAVKLSSSGFNVIGIDVNSKRIERLKDNVLMDSELSLKEQFLQSRKEKKLLLSESPLESKFSKIGIICVPTPIPQDDVKSDIFVRKAVENFLEFEKK